MTSKGNAAWVPLDDGEQTEPRTVDGGGSPPKPNPPPPISSAPIAFVNGEQVKVTYVRWTA